MPRRAHRPSHARRAPRRSVLWRVAMSCLRAVALLFVLQLAWVPHSLAEGFVACDSECADGSCETPCAEERDGRRCPPGCPTCHCEHAATPGVLPSLPPQLGELVPWPEPVHGGAAAPRSPPSTTPSSLERPPRA